MKQNGVPAIKNINGEVAVKEDGHVQMKPHGHGDIHLLMSQVPPSSKPNPQNHLPEKWHAMGIKYIIFFQDTNGLSMHGYPLLVGVAEKFGFDFCSMTIVRRPGEKVGGICKLVNEHGESLTCNVESLQHANGDQMVCNVEYNQLEGVLKASTGEGDVANASGNSKCGLESVGSPVATRATSTCCASAWRTT